MKIEKSKDSMSRIINDYIDGAFPLPEYKGPNGDFSYWRGATHE